ncbi:uncharacterized protein [Littorina saxatilis]|uniref:Uncharacterized protein n=1 Tax=Littorina saxatilis TaxID=31220 RepID=A0AAN9GFS7_9CAEN
MARKPVYGYRWAESTLERAGRKGEEVYLRAVSRRVAWSPVKLPYSPYEEDMEVKTVEDAFAAMMTNLQLAARECKRYHCNNQHVKENRGSYEHCARFHTVSVAEPVHKRLKGNPVQQEEMIHVELPKGDYSVTAQNMETKAKRTDIIHVETLPVTLDFAL